MPQYITGLVIRKNNNDFIGDPGVYKSGASIFPQGIGVIMGDIPVPGNSNGGAAIDGDFWAVPVNYGTFSGYKFLPYNNAPGGQNSVQPDPQAFAVFKLSLQPPFGSDYWYVVGTTAQYLAAAGGGAALPLNISTNPAPCSTICNQDPTAGATNGQFMAILGMPNKAGNAQYYAYGWFNKAALPSPAATGYATAAALLSFLNTASTPVLTNGVVTSYTGGWAIVGTWTLSADNLTAIVKQTAGLGTDVLCAAIININPSA